MKKILFSRSMSVATKQFLALFLVVFVVICVFEYYSLKDSINRTNKSVVDDSNAIIERTSQILLSHQENIKNLVTAVSFQKSLLQEGREYELEAALTQYVYLNSTQVKTLYVIKDSGKVFCSKQVYFDILGGSKLKDIQKLMESNSGGISWSNLYHSELSGDTVAVMKAILNSGNDKIIGWVVAELNMDYVTNLIQKSSFSDKRTLLVLDDSNAPIIYNESSDILPYSKGNYPPLIDKTFIDLIGEQKGVTLIKWDKQKLHLIKQSTGAFGWSIAILISDRYINEKLSVVYNNVYVTTLILLFILVFGIFFITYYFTYPLRLIAVKMNKVNDILTFKKIDIKRNDEFGILVRSYNEMMERIKQLSEEKRKADLQKKEYELKMLQSQIGPHFLYNTLACIASLANQHKIDQVRETVRDLVSLLSYTFDKVSDFVTLSEEIDGLEAYVRIQNTRYGEAFNFKVKGMGETRNCLIPRLILQPIVENSIFHGIKPKRIKGLIDIKCIIMGENLIIKIRDNGIGIEKDKLGTYLMEKRQTQFKGNLNSIGIFNVNERIKLYYGEKYGLQVLSRRNQGTVITIKIPKVNRT